MSIATLVTRGIGPDNSIAAMLLRGFTTAPTTGNWLVTRGFGSTTTIAGMLLRGYTPSTATQSVTVCTATTWTGYSLQEDQTPPVVVGDVFYADLVTSPGGYAITVNGDGTVEIDAHGDTTRQRFQADIFDTSLGSFYGAFTVYINNHAPQIQMQPDDVAVLTNNAMTALNFTPTDPLAINYIIDQDTDPLTSTQISGSLPAGVTLSGNILSGTPTAAISNNLTIRFTDTVGEYVDCTFNYLADIGAVVPNVVGRTLAEGTSDLAGVGLLIDAASTTSYSATVPVGNITAQGTSAGTRVFSNSSVIIDTSLGPTPTTSGVPNVVALSKTSAMAAIESANLNPVTTVVESAVAIDTVITQSPAAGANVAAFSDVTIYVSAGAPVAGSIKNIRVKPRRGHIGIKR